MHSMRTALRRECRGAEETCSLGGAVLAAQLWWLIERATTEQTPQDCRYCVLFSTLFAEKRKVLTASRLQLLHLVLLLESERGQEQYSEVGITRASAFRAVAAAAARRGRELARDDDFTIDTAASSTSISPAKHYLNHTYQPQIWSSTTSSPCSARSARTTYVNTPDYRTLWRGNDEQKEME
jgi:hypothetical protein